MHSSVDMERAGQHQEPHRNLPQHHDNITEVQEVAPGVPVQRKAWREQLWETELGREKEDKTENRRAGEGKVSY